MNRLGLLLVLLLIASAAQAGPAVSAPGFDAVLATQVYATALGFIAPRTLEPIGVPQLTVWGLRGLSALDPNLVSDETAGQFVLGTAGRVIYAGAPPPEPSPQAWATVAVAVTQAGWRVSPALRRAGTQRIFQSFFNEMFNHLDPYSRYVRPERAAEEEAQRQGSAGAGMTLTKLHGAVLVDTIDPNGPAAADLHRGDRIISVDEKAAAGQQAATVAGWLAGPDGSTVQIAWRTREGRLRQADIVRAVTPPRTVFPARVADMLLLQLTGFSRNTDVSFVEPIAQALDSNRPPQGLVIDLRGNRGGLLIEAVTVADALLPAGVVAIEQGRDPAANRVWRSASGELARDVPVVVLVDGRTASAGEILAAALSDRGRAVVVGSSTLGKGLVQTFTTLPDGGELFVTWSRVLAPLGWPIQGLGVLPQVCTSRGEAALDRQLQSLSGGAQPMAAAIERARSARAIVPPAEIVAIRNACPAAEGSELDLDAAHFLIDNPAAYAAALLPPMGH